MEIKFLLRYKRHRSLEALKQKKPGYSPGKLVFQKYTQFF
ncbi:hypothetical protein LEP1GSC161_0666 [Leptospira santarosai str. CBC1416]|uniref:Uncharacterized protein n=1 Tax=Leptospira santarosai str. CBC1416 TaxID=1193059 RepID=M6W4M9_9LEPT|nr:hypothetical protein LEP1GSC161_0666 [Leptospira santarosai str. CBC1416]